MEELAQIHYCSVAAWSEVEPLPESRQNRRKILADLCWSLSSGHLPTGCCSHYRTQLNGQTASPVPRWFRRPRRGVRRPPPSSCRDGWHKRARFRRQADSDWRGRGEDCDTTLAPVASPIRSAGRFHRSGHPLRARAECSAAVSLSNVEAYSLRSLGLESTALTLNRRLNRTFPMPRV